MTFSGNIGSDGSHGTPFLPLSSGVPTSGFHASGIPTRSGVLTTVPQTSRADTGRVGQTYYVDTQSSGGFHIGGQFYINIGNLNNIPPPNSSAGSVPGNAGLGNLFLEVNPLVAFFIDFNEIANTLRKLSLVQAQIVILQLAIANDLALAKASAILAAAKADYISNIAAAVASFAEAGVALVQLGASFRAGSEAEETFDTEETNLKTRVNNEEKNVEDADNELGEADTNRNSARAHVADAERNLANAEKTYGDLEKKGAADEDLDAAHNEVVKAKAELKNAQEDLEDANVDYRNAQKHANKEQEDLETAKKELDNFKIHRTEKQINYQQSLTQNRQLVGQVFTKLIAGVADLIKAKEALDKGLANAREALFSSYEQAVYKQIDLVNGDRSSNEKEIADIFQLLRNFSDQEKKFATLTAQAAA